MKLDTAADIIEMIHERSYYGWHPAEPADYATETAAYLAYCVRVTAIVERDAQSEDVIESCRYISQAILAEAKEQGE